MPRWLHATDDPPVLPFRPCLHGPTPVSDGAWGEPPKETQRRTYRAPSATDSCCRCRRAAATFFTAFDTADRGREPGRFGAWTTRFAFALPLIAPSQSLSRSRS
jgi:hypothetical protein